MPNDISNHFREDDADSLSGRMNGVSLTDNSPSNSRSQTPKPSAASINSGVADFFRSFDGPKGYTYDPSATSQAEFIRLADLRLWGDKLRRKHKAKLDAILAGQNNSNNNKSSSKPTPMEAFLRSHECEGSSFKFRPDVPLSTQWQNLRKSRGFTGNEYSFEYDKLQNAWFDVVENDLNDLLPGDQPNVWSWVCFKLELITQAEYEAGITCTRAKKLVSGVFVNIFTFQAWARKGYQGGIGGLRMFPSKAALRKWTFAIPGRTFPLRVAKKHGNMGVAQWLLHDFRGRKAV